jgi:mRNA interferase MazF
MEKFIKGDIVVVPFPFTDLTEAKRRPALVITALSGDDVILCQITSKQIKDSYAESIEDKDFEKGGLHQASNIRPNRIFTADRHIVLYKIGHLKTAKINHIIERVVKIVKS